MRKNTKGTSDRTGADNGGLQKRKGLKPWEIATRLFRTDAGQVVSVEQATDEEFQAFVVRSAIPVEESDIPGWSFDDRVRAINFALREGIALELFEPKDNSNISQTILEKGSETASEAM